MMYEANMRYSINTRYVKHSWDIGQAWYTKRASYIKQAQDIKQATGIKQAPAIGHVPGTTTTDRYLPAMSWGSDVYLGPKMVQLLLMQWHSVWYLASCGVFHTFRDDYPWLHWGSFRRCISSALFPFLLGLLSSLSLLWLGCPLSWTIAGAWLFVRLLFVQYYSALQYVFFMVMVLRARHLVSSRDCFTPFFARLFHAFLFTLHYGGIAVCSPQRSLPSTLFTHYLVGSLLVAATWIVPWLVDVASLGSPWGFSLSVNSHLALSYES